MHAGIDKCCSFDSFAHLEQLIFTVSLLLGCSISLIVVALFAQCTCACFGFGFVCDPKKKAGFLPYLLANCAAFHNLQVARTVLMSH